ncbi:MAG: hypothetical protein A2754_00305 [Candidatus Magasanikbacteria bacterium RIFCSPHIGHO2_01_FULL_47_8]|uniref:Uncharacterized protein n=1 Tax=Candidatus Magasanikbacteria bacterium RIFCSPHIGHO2_01_FULL_47_8 TaxID=1798673 RepID=A0A1F6MD48_9BACT|nr:MAG: hypothetical protein A2754_00305 [Candidatus Magasanikbacteria bacterium RIFCSPHIGHO2_01_FULL_47_8]
MKQHGKSLSPTDLVNKLNEGGWSISGRHLMRGVSFSKLPVVKALLLGETLKIEVGDSNFDIPSDNIVLVSPWTIEIRETFMRRQQRKKSDGGGWHEVPTVGVTFRVMNLRMAETIQKQNEERVLRENREREDLKAKAYEAARQQFVAKLTSEFVGKKLTKIDVIDENLHIGFEDGSEMFFSLGGGDTYDAYIVVNGTILGSFVDDY